MIGTLLTGLAGIVLLFTVLWDAFESVLVPRRIGRRFRVTRYFYISIWRLWRAFARGIRKPARRETLLGFFAPLSQILLLGLWASGLIAAFALMQAAAIGIEGALPMSIGALIYMSGETFFTLGFGDITPATVLGRGLSVLESGVGFAFLGVVIGYLPTMYSAFSQREIEISLLDARAGSPPTAAEFLRRNQERGDSALEIDAMRDWERWSAQLLETHISYPQLAYYRSQHNNQSWLAALTAILDSSAVILVAAPDSRSSKQAELTFAMARHALVDVTQLFVPQYVPRAYDRLSRSDLERLRASLAGTGTEAPVADEFEDRLNGLRDLYEPYAQALAAHLLFELPPWVHAEARRDNWRGGPWDKLIRSTAPEHRTDDHF